MGELVKSSNSHNLPTLPLLLLVLVGLAVHECDRSHSAAFRLKQGQAVI
ncbi:MAG: hypothetical protein F6K59_30575 [Moorea sp. SIO3F7]|nr:hypothetical protein [Moorena sp. SIO3F7]